MDSRQVRRAAERTAHKRATRPGVQPRRPALPKITIGGPGSLNRHHIRTWVDGGREFMFHATKGLRSRLVVA